LKRIWMAFLASAAIGLVRPAPAAEKPSSGTEKAQEASEKPRSEKSVTEHSVVIGGATINYTATAGTLVVRNGDDEPYASIGYTAYTKKGADPSRRPITFAFNGGPGSSSIWLHMGALGPRRIVTVDAAPTPAAPYKVVDNAESILDKSDLVMIDPVGTGFAKAVGKAKDKDFWGTDPDIEEFSRFIGQYVTENGRWNSPKYLLGESYGTTRAAGIANDLETRTNLALNGVVLVSVALDIEAIFNMPGSDRTYPLYLPTFAAVAWYHKTLPNRSTELEPFLRDVRKFALDDYAAALMQGSDLPVAERRTIVQKLHEYTGLSEAYIEKANLRVSEPQFTQELLREHGETVGRLDARFVGPTLDLLAENSEYDPQEAAISAAFTAAFLNYYHQELKFGEGKNYVITNFGIGREWDWKHRVPGAQFGFAGPTNTGVDLGRAMVYDRNLRVLVLNGLYDLATPFAATEYMMSHLGVPAEIQKHVEMKYYEAGHMMYIHEPSLKEFKADVAAFIDRTDRL
jgi:carboxypeptidase C (cathepsin A)